MVFQEKNPSAPRPPKAVVIPPSPLHSTREPYRWDSPETPGRLDVNGVEWWACDPYPTWYRWDESNGIENDFGLRTDPADWMPDDRRMALRVAVFEMERAERFLTKAKERVQIAKNILEATQDGEEN